MFLEIEQDKRKVYLIVGLCAVLIISNFTIMGIVVHRRTKLLDKGPIVVPELTSSFDSGHSYSGVAIMSEEEFIAAEGTMSYTSYDDYVSSVSAGFDSMTPTITASGANAKLLDYCDKYFKVYYGYQRVSPIFPMAIANVETTGRADFSKTWSALFPSKYVSTDEIDTFNVIDVLSSPELFKALSTEWSTRDRGCLQMSTTYGTGNEYLNSLMSGIEMDKLQNYKSGQYATWVSRAKTLPGDRFYLPDVLMLLQAAIEDTVHDIVRNGYEPQTDGQLVAMLAVSHNSGNTFYFKDHNRKIGTWVSGEKAYELCMKVGAPEFVALIEEYARSSNKMYIDSSTAKELYARLYSEPLSTYSSNVTNYTYPIKVLYAYVKLGQLYTQ